MIAPFEAAVRVRFGDVDAAGIVFYPRYFEMLNAIVEQWCEQELCLDFATMHLARRLGIPVVEIAGQFKAPSLLGDNLVASLQPILLGKSACKIRVLFRCGNDDRLEITMTVVCMDLDRCRSVSWPDDLREKILARLQGIAA